MKKILSILTLVSSVLCVPAVSFSAPTRSMLGADGSELIESESFSAADYVQDGLMAMWDGIENAGLGLHSDSDNPIDLVGGLPLLSSGAVEINENNFRAPPGAYFYQTASAFASAVANKEFTAEIVIENEAVANGGIFGLGSNTGRGLWIFSNARFNVSAVNILASVWSQSVAPSYVNSGRFSIVVVGGENPYLVLNGISVPAVYGNLTSISDVRMYLGTLYGINEAKNSDVRFYSVRLYDRVLGKEEIIWNRIVDYRRFGL